MRIQRRCQMDKQAIYDILLPYQAMIEEYNNEELETLVARIVEEEEN
jgi:hypothetical protein